MMCPKCLEAVGEGVKVCPHCKAPLTTEQKIVAALDKILIVVVLGVALAWWSLSR